MKLKVKNDNNIYLESKAKVARRWGFGVKGGVSILSYGELALPDGVDDNNGDGRSDIMIRAEAVASVSITDWFVVALANKAEVLITDYVPLAESGETVNSPGYVYNDIFLRLSVRY